MNRQEIEALVLSVVDRVLKGRKVEDSLIECKGEWPHPSKARQLAAHANSAHGEEVVWIIGLDEREKELTSPTSPELANWWSQMASRFDDQVTPEMRDLIVRVDEEAFVTALVFTTDRAPYVIKVADSEGRVERDVPIRDGTRTRSAHRHELLRLLHPASVPPPVSLIEADLSATSKTPDQGTSAGFNLTTYLYIEQRMDETVMIPQHLMRCRVSVIRRDDSEVQEIELDPFTPYTFRQDTPEPKYGIHGRPDGITVAGSAVMELRAVGGSNKRATLVGDYSDIKAVDVEIGLFFAGSTRPTVISERLTKVKVGKPNHMGDITYKWHLK